MWSENDFCTGKYDVVYLLMTRIIYHDCLINKWIYATGSMFTGCVTGSHWKVEEHSSKVVCNQEMVSIFRHDSAVLVHYRFLEDL